ANAAWSCRSTKRRSRSRSLSSGADGTSDSRWRCRKIVPDDAAFMVSVPPTSVSLLYSPPRGTPCETGAGRLPLLRAGPARDVEVDPVRPYHPQQRRPFTVRCEEVRDAERC